MTSLEHPSLRSRISHSDDGLDIITPAKTETSSLIALSLWLCFWGVAEAITIMVLFSGMSVGKSLFLIIWLAVWSYGGFASFQTLIWRLRGEERMELTSTTLTLTRRCPTSKRTVSCHTSDIRSLRTIAREHTGPNENGPDRETMWAKWDIGTLKIDSTTQTF